MKLLKLENDVRRIDISPGESYQLIELDLITIEIENDVAKFTVNRTRESVTYKVNEPITLFIHGIDVTDKKSEIDKKLRNLAFVAVGMFLTMLIMFPTIFYFLPKIMKYFGF